MMRPVSPLNLPGVKPAAIAAALPAFREVDPRTLHVDERYQRSLSRRSVDVITRIVREWRWHAFKPPVCVETEAGLHVIDGQHTAIAAATHGGIAVIPVMVVPADALEDRADAFVRHNRDRTPVTSLEIYFARLAAGNEDAQTIDQVCSRAGVTILRHPAPIGRHKVGDTIAIGAIKGLVERRFAVGARRVLDVTVKARLTPVSSNHIRAIEHLLFDSHYKGSIEDEDVVSVLLAAHDLEARAQRWAVERKITLWRATASCIYDQKERLHG